MSGEQKQGDGMDVEALVKLAREAKGRAQALPSAPWTALGDPRVVYGDCDHGTDRVIVVYGLKAESVPIAGFLADARADLPTLADGVIAMADELVHLRTLKRLWLRKTEVSFGPFDRDADGGLSLPFSDAAGVGSFLFGAMAGLLEGMGEGGTYCQNYLTMAGWHPVVGSIECTIQRTGKVTPHGGRVQAEQHLARAVAMLAEHGIPWDGPTTFLPDPPPDYGKVADREHPWITLDPRVKPNALDCSRCGVRQSMPESGTASVLQAMMTAFTESHVGCHDGDAEVSGRTAANGTERDPGAGR